LAVLGLLSFAIAAAPGLAQDIAIDKAMAERSLGRADAPITIVEYASLTCPHCATFHKETLAKIKAAFIDTGKARLIFKDFPFDGLALRAAALARCAPEDRYFSVLDVLFQQQEQWSRSRDPLGALAGIGKLSGMSPGLVDSCMKNEKLLDAIVQGRLEGERQHGIESTPSFIINGKKVSGALPYAEFEKILKPLAGS
jgi:protein-disulfide isomerase